MNPIIITSTLLAFVIAMAMSEPAPGASGPTTTAAISTTTSSSGPSTAPTEHYVAGKGARFESLAGSHDNLVSLVNGLRTRSEITLVSTTITQPATGTPVTVTQSTAFTPPTRPMGYGNVTHALDYAQ